MTVREWLDFWYQTHKKPTLRPNTQMSYEQRIYGHIIPALGSIPLDKLTQNDLQQFYTNLKQSGRRKDADRYGEGLSDQTVRGCHTTLRSALAKAVEEHPKPRGRLQASLRQAPRDAGTHPGGNAASLNSSQRRRLL